MTQTDAEELSPVLVACDAVGRLMEFWGFSRHMGRIWTLLYLSSDPLTAAEVRAELSISAGSASTVLRELKRWGVVKKVWLPGERRDHFVAETDLWKMLSRVLEERELRLLRETHVSFDHVVAQLSAESRNGSAGERKLAAFWRRRVEELRRLCRNAESLLGLLLKTRRFDLSGFVWDLATD